MKLALVLVAVWLTLGPAVVADKGADPKFKIATKRDDDMVTVQTDKDKVRFDIKSPKGISSTTIEPMDGKWPDAVVLRLHLKGLESFGITNGKVTLSGAVSSQKDAPVRLWKDGKEDSPLNEKNPLWMAIRMFNAEGKQIDVIPLKGGYFEMQLPKALFEGNPKSITVEWIDFFRG